MHFREELQRLESILHFPEEVALRLSEVEYELFYGVAPVHYIRQGVHNLIIFYLIILHFPDGELV